MKIPIIHYDEARAEYLNYLKNYSINNKIIEFGDINAPGLSDIDWLIIYDETNIDDSSMLLYRGNSSKNFGYAFQHRPIFLEKKYEQYIGEFLLPTKIKVLFGSLIEKDIFFSINSKKRNISIGFEFFKRQKQWLRKSIFDNLTLKKKVALFVSIYNHSINPFFKIKEFNWDEFGERINKLRNEVLKNHIDKKSIHQIRRQSIKNILFLEKILNNWVIKNYKYVNNKKQYYSDVVWTKKIQFDDQKNNLVSSLKLFPILYKNDMKNYDYFFKKYNLLKSITSDMNSIGLKDGIIADLGFKDWFYKSFKEQLYEYKKKIKSYF